jgi:glycosyltransferase involved in cell wall biosynthesis
MKVGRVQYIPAKNPFMKVWLIQRSEPTPHDNYGAERPLRMGILAQMLSKMGHRVLWWTSTFDHYKRCHRYETDKRLPVEAGYEIQYLHGCGYSKNISLSRIRDNALVARRFSDLAEKDPERPDVILASIPTAELGLEAVNYARKRNIPVLLDIRDLWPDVFFDLVPKAFWPAVRLFSAPMKRKLMNACAGADGIIGLTDAFVEWGVTHAGRFRTDSDRVFPMGYLADNIPAVRIEEGKRFWRKMGVSCDNSELIVVFFGALGKNNDLLPVIQAAKILEGSQIPVKVIICGVGESAAEIKRKARGLSNVLFPGWVNAEQIKALLELADIGIAPYIESVNYINNIPNKPGEYLSGGLAIALSLSKGALHDLLMRQECGFSYYNRSERLAAELESLARSPSRLEILQANALTTFKESFDGIVVYTHLIKFLEQMARGGHDTFSEK